MGLNWLIRLYILYNAGTCTGTSPFATISLHNGNILPSSAASINNCNPPHRCTYPTHTSLPDNLTQTEINGGYHIDALGQRYNNMKNVFDIYPRFFVPPPLPPPEDSHMDKILEDNGATTFDLQQAKDHLRHTEQLSLHHIPYGWGRNPWTPHCTLTCM